jgi:hypothetical protein
LYSLESLRPLNVVFDSEHRLEQSDVDIVNKRIKLIESMRGALPCPGDMIEYTNEYGEYVKNAQIWSYDAATEQVSFYAYPHVPYVFLANGGTGVSFDSGGAMETVVEAAALTYVGKRDKVFKTFGHCGVTGHGAVCFQAQVNVWEYTAPNQRHPGYSTKDWRKQSITYVEKPDDGSSYHYYGLDFAFRTAAELQRWKKTYKAVEFPGAEPNNMILFLYRETDRLISRKEWNALVLPLDTRFVNGLIHVKVLYDDEAHLVTVYRFTNSGYLDPRRFVEYERARGTALSSPGADISEGINH